MKLAAFFSRKHGKTLREKKRRRGSFWQQTADWLVVFFFPSVFFVSSGHRPFPDAGGSSIVLVGSECLDSGFPFDLFVARRLFGTRHSKRTRSTNMIKTRRTANRHLETLMEGRGQGDDDARFVFLFKITL